MVGNDSQSFINNGYIDVQQQKNWYLNKIRRKNIYIYNWRGCFDAVLFAIHMILKIHIYLRK